LRDPFRDPLRDVVGVKAEAEADVFGALHQLLPGLGAGELQRHGQTAHQIRAMLVSR
jgi:hypothetical protein